MYQRFQAHTTHSFANVYYLSASFDLNIGHHQATVQEHDCMQNLSYTNGDVTYKDYLC